MRRATRCTVVHWQISFLLVCDCSVREHILLLCRASSAFAFLLFARRYARDDRLRRTSPIFNTPLRVKTESVLLVFSPQSIFANVVLLRCR